MLEDSSDMVIGTLDSGMGEVLAGSLGRLLLNNNNEEAINDKLDEMKNLTNEKKNPAHATIASNNFKRGMSVSSEDTLPLGAEEREGRESTNLARSERVAIIKELLETYLSDNYLTRDIFLLKHFRKSKEGWISLKFMSSYKRIKRTRVDIGEVEEAVRESSMLQMNVEGNKVRRLEPLPACIENYIPSRMTLVGEIPETLRNLVTLSAYFGKYGTIASIQLLRPGSNMPDILRESAQNFPKIRDQWSALVEFDEISAAGQLTETINNGSDEAGPSWALELVMPWHPDTPKNRCRSCPSSGYSSPCLTPDQSPQVTTPSRNIRGLTKRERLLLNRSRQNNCCQSYACQHQCSPHFSPSGRRYNYREPHTRVDSGSTSPRHYKTQLTAMTCDNWRAASSPH
ncbi:uncharacterized protein LOC121872013 [Homarus americanus]|uniref:uncharacterized protein LOC121872013 n=1 Tax=Homarus americanus TaxID=6706 RepID=UPI001C43DA5D|nr:uncharacterized protein LOC121872013 [Homarus americanus]XP_042230577.1 uncharacterized protein LOC121872013 [Homarus americanus]